MNLPFGPICAGAQAGDLDSDAQHTVEVLVALSNPSPLFRRLIQSAPAPGRRRRPEFERQQQTHLSDEARSELIARYVAGAKAHELAVEFNLCRQAVAATLERAGVKRSIAMTAGEGATAAQLYAQGWSLVRTGEELSRAPNTVRRALLEAGVVMRDTHGRERP